MDSHLSQERVRECIELDRDSKSDLRFANTSRYQLLHRAFFIHYWNKNTTNGYLILFDKNPLNRIIHDAVKHSYSEVNTDCLCFVFRDYLCFSMFLCEGLLRRRF